MIEMEGNGYNASCGTGFRMETCDDETLQESICLYCGHVFGITLKGWLDGGWELSHVSESGFRSWG